MAAALATRPLEGRPSQTARSSVPVCRVCREAIVGQHVSTTNARYHQACFVCHHCLEPFANNVFFEAEGNFYCEPDFGILHGARCGKCGDIISGKCVSALDAKWHLDHFNCENCGRSLVGSSFIRKGDRPYCKQCPMDRKVKQSNDANFDVTCDNCKKPMLNEDALIYHGKPAHAYHFQCSQCKKTLTPQAKEFDGELYCLSDYEKILQNVCHACRRPIAGRSISAMGKVYHPEHFVCYKCDKPFDGVSYFQYQSRPYCEEHYKEMTGAVCEYCHAPAKGNVVTALGFKYCEHHFMCYGCFTNLAEGKSKFSSWDGKPFCRRCFDKIPSTTRRNLTKYKDSEKKYNPDTTS